MIEMKKRDYKNVNPCDKFFSFIHKKLKSCYNLLNHIDKSNLSQGQLVNELNDTMKQLIDPEKVNIMNLLDTITILPGCLNQIIYEYWRKVSDVKFYSWDQYL